MVLKNNEPFNTFISLFDTNNYTQSGKLQLNFDKDKLRLFKFSGGFGSWPNEFYAILYIDESYPQVPISVGPYGGWSASATDHGTQKWSKQAYFDCGNSGTVFADVMAESPASIYLAYGFANNLESWVDSEYMGTPTEIVNISRVWAGSGYVLVDNDAKLQFQVYTQNIVAVAEKQ